MTRKDFYNAVIEANISEDMNAFADKERAKLAHEAEYRRNTPTKKQRENEDIKATILTHFTAGVHLSGAEVAEAVGITSQKANALLKQLATEGKIVVEEVKNGKRLVNSYSIAE